MNPVENVLAHYGVKGMRWGVRRGESGPTAVELKATPGKRVSATGGKGQSPSDDAKSAASLRQKAKASTPDALSNKELQALVTRMNLEQQYARLSAPKKSAGREFVKRLFVDEKFRNKSKDTANTLLEYPRAAVELGKAIERVKL